MEVEVREARAADKGRSIELLSLLIGEPQAKWGEVYDALLARKRGEVLVAEEDGRLLGIATVSYNLAIRYQGEYCQLEELVVDPEARGKNIGGRLVRATIDRARARGCAEYGLYLVDRTERNQPFYEKYGMKRVGSEMRQALR